jgi:hypothetical protein
VASPEGRSWRELTTGLESPAEQGGSGHVPETGEVISQTVSGEKGPHPDLDSGFEIYCNVIVPALA